MVETQSAESGDVLQILSEILIIRKSFKLSALLGMLSTCASATNISSDAFASQGLESTLSSSHPKYMCKVYIRASDLSTHIFQSVS